MNAFYTCERKLCGSHFAKFFRFFIFSLFINTMIKVSRRKTRSYLLQALYARSMGGVHFDEPGFLQAFFDETAQSSLDVPYFQAMFS